MNDYTHKKLPNIAFIVGMGRSGTTMLTSMLNMNRHVVATPENEFILFSYSTFSKKDFTELSTINSFSGMFNYNYNNVINIWKPVNLKQSIEQLAQKSYADICKLVYLQYPLAQKNADEVKWVIDKNPSYSLHIEKLQKVYPCAKYIIITRDYRDNILSRKKYSDKNSSVYKLAAAWNYYYDKIFESVTKFKLPSHIVRYEDLAQNPKKALTEICSFLEIEFSDDMLNFQDFSKVIKSHAKITLSQSKYEKVSNMHSNLDKAVNTERLDAFKKELPAKDIDLLDALCYKNGKKFNYIPYSENPQKQLALTKVKYKIALLQIIFYNRLNRFYYKLPVSFRLLFKLKEV